MKKLTIFIIVFLLIGAYVITTRGNYDIKENPEDRKSFLKDFSGWMISIGKNMAEITGLVQKQEWIPQEYNATDTLK